LKKLALCFCLLIYSSQVARASTITFDDGTAGSAIGTFYASLGITFSNASWVASSPSLQIGSSTLLADVTDNGFNPPYSPTPTTPIVGTFSSSEDFVSILGIGIGDAGMELDAYDAITGGNLVASAQFYGTGTGVGTFQTLSVSAPGILRFDLFQPSPAPGDSIAFDNLTFDADPPAPDPSDIGIEPGTWILIASGLLALIGLRFWMRLRLQGPTNGRVRVYGNRLGDGSHPLRAGGK
jgi:hypothetical protein